MMDVRASTPDSFFTMSTRYGFQPVWLRFLRGVFDEIRTAQRSQRTPIVLQSIVEVPLQKPCRQIRLGGVNCFTCDAQRFEVAHEERIVQHFVLRVASPLLGTRRVTFAEV